MSFFRGLLGSCALLIAGLPLSAHAVLVKSSPQADGTVKGPTFPIVLTFNSKIDQTRSKLTLEAPDRTQQPIVITKDTHHPEILASKPLELKPGVYKVLWQVLAIDGHITRGQVVFHAE